MLEQSALSAADQEDSAAAATAERVVPRLLVVDDDTLHRMIICRTAANAGYLPAGAATYNEAVKLLQATAFDCITLDLSLGEHAGVEMLRYLWVIGWKAPIIIISGCDDATHSDSETVAESLKLNVWESMSKPVDISVLRESLERLKAAQVSPA